MPSLDALQRALDAREPTTISTDGKRHAAVALCLRETAEDTEILFIERAERSGDPWSGHMAFPGGRLDPGDATARGAAERETREEVGIDLGRARLLGRLDDLEGHHVSGAARMVISAFVYRIVEPAHLVTNHEVHEALWFPLGSLHDPERHIGMPPQRTAGMRFPGILVGEPERHVVWGLTYRFLEVFFELLGDPLPMRWTDGPRGRGDS